MTCLQGDRDRLRDDEGRLSGGAPCIFAGDDGKMGGMLVICAGGGWSCCVLIFGGGGLRVGLMTESRMMVGSLVFVFSAKKRATLSRYAPGCNGVPSL